MDKKEARAIVRGWLKDVSAEVGWKLKGLTIWSTAIEWRIGIRLRPSTWGTFFFVDCLVFMHEDTVVTRSDAYTIDFPLSTLIAETSLHEAIDFDGRQTIMQIAKKAKLFKQIMCDEVIPSMSALLHRPALTRWIRQHPYALSAKLRMELGIILPDDSR